MPRAEIASKQAAYTLGLLHAELAGKLLENKRAAVKIRTSMMQVEAVLKMLRPDFNIALIAPKRRVVGNPWFKRGTLFRHALDALRAAAEPLTVREIADAVIAAHNLKNVTTKQHYDLQAGIRSSLENHAGKTVERIGEGVPRRWRIKT